MTPICHPQFVVVLQFESDDHPSSLSPQFRRMFSQLSLRVGPRLQRFFFPPTSPRRTSSVRLSPCLLAPCHTNHIHLCLSQFSDFPGPPGPWHFPPSSTRSPHQASRVYRTLPRLAALPPPCRFFFPFFFQSLLVLPSERSHVSP